VQNADAVMSQTAPAAYMATREIQLAPDASVQISEDVKPKAMAQFREKTSISVSPPTALVFENDVDLANHRREAVRADLLAKAERRADPTGELLNGTPLTYFEMKKALINQRLSSEELQEVWEHLDTVETADVIQAFALINLSGSGQVCSNDFACGVERVGVPWQKLTGLRRPKDLFALFDQQKDGVLTLFELFPTQRHVKKDDSGISTPDFWKKWCIGNPAKSFCPDQPKGRNPPWSTGVADDGLNIMYGKDKSDADAAFMRKWMQTTMRRLKGRGKSDARCREMCCLHLPRGSGPKDRQEVSTFSEAEVKQCRREYQDAVQEPQREVEKALYELRETRKELANSRHKLWSVAMEPVLRQQALEEQKNIAKSMGLNLGLGKKEEKPEAASPAAPGVDAGMADAFRGLTPF
jgi:hypothetical protein